MSSPAQFDHDRLGHLLSDRLLKVPSFQRSYAWEESNVTEFLEDLEKARISKRSHFMGTIVLAQDREDAKRQLIVDGQQRLATAAILLTAIRDQLRKLGRQDLAKSIDQTYLRRFELNQEGLVTRLLLSARDFVEYDQLLNSKSIAPESSRLSRCYAICLDYAARQAPTQSAYRSLVEIVSQLDENVQVLLAIASNVSEAYVIFETLNDRGTDLTTADLLKNYLFSQAGNISHVIENKWTAISSKFERPEDLVTFIKHEYSCHYGKVSERKLYRSLQRSIGTGSQCALSYLKRLEKSLDIYLALRDPDHPRWNALNFDVRDSLLAYRRFQFESSLPLLLAAFSQWPQEQAGRLLNRVAAWSVRASIAGKLGGGQAEEAFCNAALAIATNQAKTQDQVRSKVARIIPNDLDFMQALLRHSFRANRAKYMLACLERQLLLECGENIEGLTDWSSKAVNIEHIIPKSSSIKDFPSAKEYERFQNTRDSLQNLTLIEKTINRKLQDKPFAAKRKHYANSKFAITRKLADVEKWSPQAAASRGNELAKLALSAWQV